jgi:glycosyltransferase involved in cell wall biosynthesis
MPLISIIINCRNCINYLPYSLESVRSQTFKDYEIIFWDNLSTDGSDECALHFNGPLRYFKGERYLPLSDARNKAVRKAEGEYITFLDADDIWYPMKLERQIELFNEKPWLGAVYSDCYFIDPYGNVTGRWFEKSTPYQGRVFKQLLLEEFFMPIQTLITRREIIEKIGYFEPSLNIAEDNDLNLKIAYNYEIGYIAEPLAGYRLHEGCTSRDYLSLAEEQCQVCHYWEKLAQESNLPEKDLIDDIFFYKCKKMVILKILYKKDFRSAFQYLREALSVYGSKVKGIEKFISQLHITSMNKWKKYHERV